MNSILHNYIVSTHLGEYFTRAVSEAKAISNVRWRIFGRSYCGPNYAAYWTVKAVA